MCTQYIGYPRRWLRCLFFATSGKWYFWALVCGVRGMCDQWYMEGQWYVRESGMWNVGVSYYYIDSGGTDKAIQIN